jgi:hypothetical protein
MEHEEAKRMDAAEKYVLGELKGELRDQYEEHYFDCPECALDVKAMAAFVAASKDIFRETPAPAVPAGQEREKAIGWRFWLKPLIAVPAMAILAVMLVYEGHHLKSGSSEPVVVDQNLVASESFGLRGGDRVANENTVVRVKASEAFGLHFDFTPTQTFEKYVGEVQDQSGRALLRFGIAGERINKEVKIVVPAGLLNAGNYVLIAYGDAAATTSQAGKTAVASFPFTIEILP